MSDNPNSIENRLETIQTTILALIEIAEARDPSLHKDIVQKLHGEIWTLERDHGVPKESVDVKHPRSPVGKGLRAVLNQLKG